MAYPRDLPCSNCGDLMWRSDTSLPQGEATCLPCRRARLIPRDCIGCGASFAVHKPGNPKRYCSRVCANASTARTKAARPDDGLRRSGRACEVCGDRYKANYAGQRSCGRECGLAIRYAGLPGKTCVVYFPECGQCSQVFTARSSRHKLCSAQCRIDASGMRVKDLYALIVKHRGQGPAASWRKNLVDLLRDRDGDHCKICLLDIDFTLPSGPKGDDAGASIDHIQPRSLGGSDELTNLRLAHWGCNRKRKNNVHEDALFAA